MHTNLEKGDKKNALQTYKDKLLTEIYYYDKRIEEARNNVNKSSSFEDADASASSDSDSELSLLMDRGPSISQLKNQEAMLKTCLQATQELTNLEVLQSEVNVLVEEPKIEGEPPITEPGIWREVMAECCVDLVPFNITFYSHHGDAQFAPIIYRGLRVMPMKSSHEAELAKSVLPDLKRPSDAIEVLRSYATAHRSRRSSLARLADKFGAALFMEPMPAGGYLMKCANILEVSWTLQNKWSPVAPFHHRLKFDLEYMEESYIKIITQAHRQLSDPSVDTDERTLLLAKIISTCLAAKPLEPDSSDQEARGEVADSPVKDGTVERRRMTLDREPELPNMKKKKDSEVMAPPKSLPKKVKPKTKSPPENETADPKTTKRSIKDDDSNKYVKKPKMNDNSLNEKKERKKETESTAENVKTVDNDISNACSVANVKNKGEKSKSDGAKVNNGTAKINYANEDAAGKTQNSESTKKGGTTKIPNKKLTEPENNKNDENTSSKNVIQAVKMNVVDNIKNLAKKSETLKRKSMTNLKSKIENQKNTKTSRNSIPNSNKKVVNDKTNFDKNNEKERRAKSANIVEKKKIVEKEVSNKDGNVIKIVKNITNEKGEVVKKVVKKLVNDKPKVTEKVSAANEQNANLPKKTIINNKVEGSESVKKNTKKTDQMKKPSNENEKRKTLTQTTVKKDIKSPPKVSKFTANSNSKKITTATIEKENLVQNNMKSSRIPQKKIESPKSVIKKMAVRVSPRKPISKSKPPLAGAKLKKIVQKPVTAIPRLLTKPRPKVM